MAIKIKGVFWLSLLAIISWTLYAIPPLHFIYKKANLPTFYSENIGYHFFQSMRFVDGSKDDLIISSGVVVPLVQNIYYAVCKLISPNLIDQILIYGYLTILIPTVLMFALLIAISWNKSLPQNIRIILILSPLVFSLTHIHSFSWHLYPDYPHYVKLIFLFTFYYYIKNFIYAKPNFLNFLVIGILAGIISSIKIPLGFFPISLISIYLIPHIRNSTIVRSYLGFIGAAILTFILLTVILYWKNPINSFHYVSAIFKFGMDLKSNAILGDFSPFGSWTENNYANLSILFIFLSLIVIANLVIGKLDFSKTAFIGYFLLGIYAVWACFKRGSGGSYTDGVVVVTLLIPTLCAISYKKISAKLSSVVCIIFLFWPLFWIYQNFTISYISNNGLLPNLGTIGKWQNEIYEWNKSHKMKIVGIFPSNSYVVGTIEDMMMRGFSNFSEVWYSSNNNYSLKNLFPDYFFGSYDIVLPPRPLVIMYITSDQSFPLVNKSELEIHNKYLNNIMDQFNKGPCYEVDYPLFNAKIKSCVIFDK